jgi:hypothetical protein
MVLSGSGFWEPVVVSLFFLLRSIFMFSIQLSFVRDWHCVNSTLVHLATGLTHVREVQILLGITNIFAFERCLWDYQCYWIRAVIQGMS